MSKTSKWVIGIIVIIIIAFLVWHTSMSNGTTSQSAAVVNSTVASNMFSASSLALINRDIANLDSQISLSASELTTVGTASSPAQISSVAKQLANVSSITTQVGNEIAYNIPKASLPTFQPTLTDINQQVANVQIQLGAINNTQKPQTIAQELTELQVAQNYLKAARADIGTLVKGK